MKYSAITFALAGFLAAIPFAGGTLNPAFADDSLRSPYPLQEHETFSTWVLKRNALMELRKEVVKLQAADGGKLTQAHHDYLQAKLNAILAGNY